jgi:hypothetical protein
MKTIKHPINSGAKMLRWRLTLLVLLLLCHFGVPVTSYGWVPCPQPGTNMLSGEVLFAPWGMADHRAGSGHGPAVAWDARAAAYRFWWEAKDSIRYGIPYLIQNEPPTLVASGVCVIAAACFAFRSFIQSCVK